jgi:enoyl-CoA hydratase/carnithine racemase
MPLAPESFLYEHDRETGVATVTLNRPERLNALTFEVYGELREAFVALDAEPGVRAVVLTGSGSAFCSGGDVEDIIGPLFERDYRGLLEFTRATGDLVLAILRCRRPVVAALNGTVAGAGAVIASACDLRIASERAKIAFLFTKVGLSGADMGASWLLPRLVGHGRAMELLLGGEFIDAQEAYRIGLYNAVVPNGELAHAARERAEKLARGPAFGLEVTKKMLVREAAMDVESAMAAETEIQAACMLDPNFREAYEAFKAKRKPEFDQRKPEPRESERDGSEL